VSSKIIEIIILFIDKASALYGFSLKRSFLSENLFFKDIKPVKLKRFHPYHHKDAFPRMRFFSVVQNRAVDPFWLDATANAVCS
jgi:hypothetical protein